MVCISYVKFPCGQKGRTEYCPALCKYGEFCKVKDKKDAINPPASKLMEEVDKENNPDNVKVETYYD